MHLGFPLETVQDKEEIKQFFRKLMKYFDFIVSDNDVNTALVPYYIFPTVFSENINIETHNENEESLDIQVFSLTGNILFSEK